VITENHFVLYGMHVHVCVYNRNSMGVEVFRDLVVRSVIEAGVLKTTKSAGVISAVR
jgi:hypothetical protein